MYGYKFQFMRKGKECLRPEKVYEKIFNRYDECMRMETILRETVENADEYYALIRPVCG